MCRMWCPQGVLEGIPQTWSCSTERLIPHGSESGVGYEEAVRMSRARGAYCGLWVEYFLEVGRGRGGGAFPWMHW